MSHIRYAEVRAPERAQPLIRLFRILILVGVWTLVGLAGLAVWLRLTP